MLKWLTLPTITPILTIGTPDNILKKPGKLTTDEFEIMKSHCQLGGDVLGDDSSELLQLAKVIALTHHEKWNGLGYPNKLAGEDIPWAGRVVAITDVFDALTSNRPYKKAWTLENTIGLMKDESGKHFDPHLLSVFFEVLPEILDIKKQYAEEKMM